MRNILVGHCKDCRFWESHVNGHDTAATTCEAAGWVRYDQKLNDDSFAVYADANDDQGLEAGLKTGPLFGCVKFQQK